MLYFYGLAIKLLRLNPFKLVFKDIVNTQGAFVFKYFFFSVNALLLYIEYCCESSYNIVLTNLILVVTSHA